MHAPGITDQPGDSHKAVPRVGVFSNHEPWRNDIAVVSNLLQQTTPPEPIVVPAKPVILKPNQKGS